PEQVRARHPHFQAADDDERRGSRAGRLHLGDQGSVADRGDHRRDHHRNADGLPRTERDLHGLPPRPGHQPRLCRGPDPVPMGRRGRLRALRALGRDLRQLTVLDQAEMPHRLESFLKRRLPGARSITVGGYEPLLGGYTRLTARFRVSVDGVDTWHVVRGDPPPERSIADTDRNAEWRLLTSLHGLGEVPIPAPEHVDPDGSELGTRAIVSSFIPGDSLVARGRAADEDELRRLSGSLAETAARIHRTDVTGLPGDLAVP